MVTDGGKWAWLIPDGIWAELSPGVGGATGPAGNTNRSVNICCVYKCVHLNGQSCGFGAGVGKALPRSGGCLRIL